MQNSAVLWMFYCCCGCDQDFVWIVAITKMKKKIKHANFEGICFFLRIFEFLSELFKWLFDISCKFCSLWCGKLLLDKLGKKHAFKFLLFIKFILNNVHKNIL